MLENVNWVAVVVSAVVLMALGFAWYGPLFGKQWMKLSGLSKSDLDKAKSKGMTMGYAVSMLGAVVMALVLNMLVAMTNTVGATGGAMLGFWVWLGFVATTMLNSVSYEGKPWDLYFINAGYYLVALVVMGAVLTSL